MPVWTVEIMDSESHWCFLASFVNRLDLCEFVRSHRKETRIVCGSRLMIDLRRVSDTVTEYQLRCMIFNLTDVMMPKAVTA